MIISSIIFLIGYRHFQKGKVKQGFIYENAKKKVLENCNFCPGKSLILLNKKVYEPCAQLNCEYDLDCCCEVLITRNFKLNIACLFKIIYIYFLNGTAIFFVSLST
jgi:hypothetical protein